MKRVLVYGYGNPGRQDDGLGVKLASLLEAWRDTKAISWLDVEVNYQLNIEDALTISDYDVVFFADASIEDIKNMELTKVMPSSKTEFTMHATTPAFILHLCHSLYDKYPETYLLHIKGYEFEFMEPLTTKAKSNLATAEEFTKKYLSDMQKQPDSAKAALN